MLQDAEGYLQCVASRLGPDVVAGRTVLHGDPAAEIAVAAEEFGAAAVVMANHGRTGPMRTLLGSVAGHVMHAGAQLGWAFDHNRLRAAEAPLELASAGSVPPHAASRHPSS